MKHIVWTADERSNRRKIVYTTLQKSSLKIYVITCNYEFQLVSTCLNLSHLDKFYLEWWRDNIIVDQWNHSGKVTFKISIKSRMRRTSEVEMQRKISRTGNKSCMKHLFFFRSFVRWPILIFCMHATFSMRIQIARNVCEKVIQQNFLRTKKMPFW